MEHPTQSLYKIHQTVIKQYIWQRKKMLFLYLWHCTLKLYIYTEKMINKNNSAKLWFAGVWKQAWLICFAHLWVFLSFWEQNIPRHISFDYYWSMCLMVPWVTQSPDSEKPLEIANLLWPGLHLTSVWGCWQRVSLNRMAFGGKPFRWCHWHLSTTLDAYEGEMEFDGSGISLNHITGYATLPLPPPLRSWSH